MADHIHSKYLLRLSHQLHHAEIEMSDVKFTLLEPDWYRSDGNPRSLCDMIVGLKNGYAIPIELKADTLNKRDKAIKQLSQGVFFANKILHLPVSYGVFMVYDQVRNVYLPPIKIIDELPDQSNLDSIISSQF